MGRGRDGHDVIRVFVHRFDGSTLFHDSRHFGFFKLKKHKKKKYMTQNGPSRLFLLYQ